MKTRRIGVAVNAQHLRVEQQQIWSGVREYAEQHAGFECLLAPFALDELRRAGDQAPYDGLVAQATPELVAQAKQMQIPVVDVWRDSTVKEPIDCVFPDFAMAGRAAGKHMVSRGFESFGFVLNRRAQSQITMCDSGLLGEDALGFAAYIRARGFKCEEFKAPKDVCADADSWRKWIKEIREWILEQPKPLGLFVPSDFLCRQIADMAPQLELGVPHDLGLVCAENETNLCLLGTPSLTAVDLGFRRVGYEAAVLLESRMEDPDAAREREIRHLESHSLHPRRSTDASAVKDPLVSSSMQFISEHSHHGIMVSDVARHENTTRRTLERHFREVLNRTVGQEITRCRLERLKQRLAESDTPIKILTIDSGFNSVRVLYETFVREEGMSPSAYRVKRRGGTV